MVALLGVVLLGVGADHPRLDAELAERQPLVGAELDLRAADQREALAAGVLEQVGGELVDDLVLDALERSRSSGDSQTAYSLGT